MIDLAAIQSRLDRGVESLTDTHDLLHEVKRLRAEVAAERAARLQLLDDAGGLENERDGQRKRADSLALAYREQQGENDALRAANTVLFAERDLYREAWATAQAHLDCGSDAADAVREERAAVVAWLRGHGMAHYAKINLDYAATMIERGEHRREEGKA